MPLDGHSYLVSQGWEGSGNGLRQGSISRPLAIPQKRNLAGLGKDRDEAFPFWDQLSVSTAFYLLKTNFIIYFSVFAAAAKSIQVKISKDDSDSVRLYNISLRASLI